MVVAVHVDPALRQVVREQGFECAGERRAHAGIGLDAAVTREVPVGVEIELALQQRPVVVREDAGTAG